MAQMMTQHEADFKTARRVRREESPAPTAREGTSKTYDVAIIAPPEIRCHGDQAGFTDFQILNTFETRPNERRLMIFPGKSAAAAPQAAQPHETRVHFVNVNQ